MTAARTFARMILCASAAAVLSMPFGAAAQKADMKAAPAEKQPEVPSYYGLQPATENIDLTMYARIREEGLKHSHVMQFAEALNDGIGSARRTPAAPTTSPSTRWASPDSSSFKTRWTTRLTRITRTWTP